MRKSLIVTRGKNLSNSFLTRMLDYLGSFGGRREIIRFNSCITISFEKKSEINLEILDV